MPKRDDPNFKPLRGHIPIHLYEKFKIYCIQEKMDNSAGLENVIKFYFDYRKKVAPANDMAEEFEKIRGKQTKGKGV